MASVPEAPSVHVCSSPEQLVRQLKALPPVPKIMLRLQPMLADCNTDINDVANLIRLERSLAARLIQVSNSAYMGLGSRARSVEEAINRLGFREVRRIVSVVIGMHIMEKPLSAYGIDARDLWRQSIACAIAAELFAPNMGEDGDAAYTLGLLHSVGMVVVNAWAAMVAPQTRLASQGYPDDCTQAERALLGFTNADTGAELLRMWDFPDSVVDPVRAQYQPVLASTQPQLAHLLLVSRWMRSAVCDPAMPQVMPDPRSMSVVGVDESALRDAVGLVRERLDEATKLLEPS